MIEVEEAARIIASTVLELPTIHVPLEKSLGRVLRQVVVADADFPPFNRVMMDGIAIRHKDFERGIRDFQILGIQAAGASQKELKGQGSCLEVMTGSIAPAGADAVVPYEEIVIDGKNKIAAVRTDDVRPGKHIHDKGSDKKAGDLLVQAGKLIGAPEIAVAASVGLIALKVTGNPSIAIVSTGEELVDIHEQPQAHQIRRSNVYALAAELKRFGIESAHYHLDDDKKNLTQKLEGILYAHDVIITSGGVSRGKFDFLPEAFEDLGVKKSFHRVKQKPGKPFWFGTKAPGKVVFAFPGNPVSTFLCFHKYFVPWLRKTLGMDRTSHVRAVLGADFEIKTGLTYFLQVKTHINENGQIVAKPNTGKGSGDHANLLSGDAFLELPGNTRVFKRGDVFNLISFRNS
ncbi:MAG: molybdopterin molybdotransferase MoeA [Cytophagales bacterium]|nr:molybdopterin molybdotransferase MoeA [Cytophagales bacterium]